MYDLICAGDIKVFQISRNTNKRFNMVKDKEPPRTMTGLSSSYNESGNLFKVRIVLGIRTTLGRLYFLKFPFYACETGMDFQTLA